MAKRILFVGAPFGPLFRELAAALEAEGAAAFRIVVDGGEFMETPRRNRIILDRTADWGPFVRRLMSERRIDTIVTYNDALPRDRIALAIAKRAGIDRLVLENGYLRPHHVTLAINGVNGNSELGRDAEMARLAEPPANACRTFPARMRPHVVNTIRHFAWATLLKPLLPYDSSYYGDPVGRQAIGYLREYSWRLLADERKAFERVTRHRKGGAGRVFLALMQKPGDSQIRIHSPFNGNAAFLEMVLRSFAAHAPSGAFLVVKQHPLDYGIEALPRLFKRLAAELGITGRSLYLRKTGIARVMGAADSIVTINSTGGLQGVMAHLPVKCLGSAVYDMPGLTFQGSLQAFWEGADAPDPDIVEAYRHQLLATCQINGGFHTRQSRDILVPALARRILAADGRHAAAIRRPMREDQQAGLPAGDILVAAE